MRLILTEAARADIRDILHSTRAQFGPLQVPKYRFMISDSRRRIRQNPGLGHHREGLPPEGRLLHISQRGNFIDTAAKTESDTAMAIEVADLVLITCRPSVMDLRAMRNSIRLCEVRRVTPHIVLTQIESQGTLQAEARASLKQLGVDVLPGGLGRRAAFHHSIIDGLAAVEYEPKGKAALEVRALYKKTCQLCRLAS